VFSEEDAEWKDNHVLRNNITVQIGLDKNTKLSAVFARYVLLCNESTPRPLKNITVEDLEFAHCQLLDPNDTAEGAALMKHDRIKVRRNRYNDRLAENEWKRQQRDSDREYFDQLSKMATVETQEANVALLCQGSLTASLSDNTADSGSSVEGNQKVEGSQSNHASPSIAVRPQPKQPVFCHAGLVKRRCKWLYDLIQEAKLELDRRSVVTVPDELKDDGDEGRLLFADNNVPVRDRVGMPKEGEAAWVGDQGIHDVQVPMDQDMPDAKPEALHATSEEEDIIQGLHPPEEELPSRGDATKIENDEDDDNDDIKIGCDSRASILNRSPMDIDKVGAASLADETMGRDLLWVVIPDHPPEAMQLLLEYCYSNRVAQLGKEAFVESCRTTPHCRKLQGPVPPHPVTGSHPHSNKRWPNNGEPSVSYEVATATLRLAEEAKMPRLSLMCQIAAARLVRPQTALYALCLCEQSAQRHQNPLPLLRQAAVSAILHSAGSKKPLTVKSGLEFGVSSRTLGLVDGGDGDSSSAILDAIPGFGEILQDHATLVVPPLLTGTLQVVQSYQDKRGGEKRDWKAMSLASYESIDREDRKERQRERWKHRTARVEGGTKMAAVAGMDEEDMMQLDPRAFGWDAPFHRLPADYNLSLSHPSRFARLSPREGASGSNSGLGQNDAGKSSSSWEDVQRVVWR
jgi:hypothetical protein